MKKTTSLLLVLLFLLFNNVVIAQEFVRAVYGEFNIIVNGEVKNLENTPLVVDGTSYLPVREISELLGYHIDYEEESRTISFVKGGEEQVSSRLSELERIKMEIQLVEDHIDIHEGILYSANPDKETYAITINIIEEKQNQLADLLKQKEALEAQLQVAE